MKSEIRGLASVCRMLLSAAALAAGWGSAAASERVGGAASVYALQRHADAEINLEREIEVVIDAMAVEDRFDLYRAFNQLSGTWSQIERLDELLRASIAAAPSEESDLRTSLREQAQFALWEIDDVEHRLASDGMQPSQLQSSRAIGTIRAFFADVRKTVERLRAEEQARPLVH
jgi:hypothetical protein